MPSASLAIAIGRVRHDREADAGDPDALGGRQAAMTTRSARGEFDGACRELWVEGALFFRAIFRPVHGWKQHPARYMPKIIVTWRLHCSIDADIVLTAGCKEATF